MDTGITLDSLNPSNNNLTGNYGTLPGPNSSTSFATSNTLFGTTPAYAAETSMGSQGGYNVPASTTSLFPSPGLTPTGTPAPTSTPLTTTGGSGTAGTTGGTGTTGATGTVGSTAPVAPSYQPFLNTLNSNYQTGVGNYNTAVGSANSQYGNAIGQAQTQESNQANLFNTAKDTGNNNFNQAEGQVSSRYGAQVQTNAQAYNDSLTQALNFLGGRNLMGSSAAEALGTRLAQSNYQSALAASNNYTEALNNITNARAGYNTAITNSLAQLHQETQSQVADLNDQLQQVLNQLNSQKNLLDSDKAQAQALIQQGYYQAANQINTNFTFTKATLSNFAQKSDQAYQQILQQVQQPMPQYQNFTPGQPAVSSLAQPGAGMAPQGNVSNQPQGDTTNPFQSSQALFGA